MSSKPFFPHFLSHISVIQANCTVMQPLINLRIHTDYVCAAKLEVVFPFR